MNVKITNILPLAIVLFASGVYCPSSPENVKECTTWYQLQSCKSNSIHLDFNESSSTYMFKCSEEDPFYCHLIEEWTGKTRTFIFKRANVEFTSMKDEEVTLIMYPYPTEIVKWGVTCEFLSIKQARKFYRYITHDRQSELMHFTEADYLKESDNTLVSEQLNLFLDGFEHNVTLVTKNDENDAVLIFPKDAISEVTRNSGLELSVTISLNRGPRMLYKFGFATYEQTAATIDLLNRMKQRIEGSYSENYRRPSRDPAVNSFFTHIRLDIIENMER